MMAESIQRTNTSLSWPARVILFCSYLVTIAFYIGGFSIGWQMETLSNKAIIVNGRLLSAQLLEAMMLAIGLGLGIQGAVTSLLYITESRRTTGTAITILGFAVIWFGFAAGHGLESTFWHSVSSPLLFTGPGILFVYTFYLLLKAAKLRKKEKQALINAEQQSLLSQP